MSKLDHGRLAQEKREGAKRARGNQETKRTCSQKRKEKLEEGKGSSGVKRSRVRLGIPARMTLYQVFVIRRDWQPGSAWIMLNMHLSHLSI